MGTTGGLLYLCGFSTGATKDFGGSLVGMEPSRILFLHFTITRGFSLCNVSPWAIIFYFLLPESVMKFYPQIFGCSGLKRSLLVKLWFKSKRVSVEGSRTIYS